MTHLVAQFPEQRKDVCPKSTQYFWRLSLDHPEEQPASRRAIEM